MNKYALGTIIGTVLLGLDKARRGAKNQYEVEDIEDIYNLSAQEKAQITYLNFNDMGITQIPDDIFYGFENLEILNFHGNQLRELPQSIRNLTNLRYLYLDHNGLTELPDSIGNLTNLKELHLINNDLTELPDSIGNLTNLEMLWLDENPLKKPVPKETILKMIRNGVHKDVIEEIAKINKSIKTKSNLRIR